MNVTQRSDAFEITSSSYRLSYASIESHFVSLIFRGEIGADLFIASGCDRDEQIDELVELGPPQIAEESDRILVRFVGKTTLWDKVEYEFTCLDDKVLYHYRVHGQGQLDNARFFEGFLQNDPRMADADYPFYCGPGRHISYHRPVKYFLTSSRPKFDLIHSYGVNCADKRIFMYYEDALIRTNGDRFYLGGDWLFTPAPFLFQLGNRALQQWANMGLVVPAGQNNFLSYEYHGGEGFGLYLDYQGYTLIDGSWQSPQILLQATDEVYQGLNDYVSHLQATGCTKTVDRTKSPKWWREPIFGGWGEQVYHSNRWGNYYEAQYDDWHGDNTQAFCTQQAYERMLTTLESKGVNPTILIVDNRWFQEGNQLAVDRDLWPDMEQFVAEQHERGRKVILWISPWSFCNSTCGKDVPLTEQMTFDEEAAFELEIDTDVFYPACRRERRKVRVPTKLPAVTHNEPRWTLLADPFDAAYERRLRSHIHALLSPEGLDADGFEFDYTHYLPQYRATRRNNGEPMVRWGVELNHKLLSIYYDEAKKVKSDSLIITQTFNPYFNDVSDMLRLQDIYTDRRSVVEQMTHRARIAQAVCPGAPIHTDQHPMPSLEAWREYATHQSKIGNHCLYYVTGIETTKEKLTDADYAMLRELWHAERPC